MNTTTITIKDVLDFIHTQSTYADTNQIAGALNARRKAIKAVAALEAKAEFGLGDRVYLTGLSPQYVNGTMVEIVGVHVSKFSVKLADPDSVPARVRNRLYGTFKVPMTCVER